VRAVLLTSGGLHGAVVLEALRASAGLELAGVVLSTRILSARFGRLHGAWAQWRRSGVRYAAYLGFTLLRVPAWEKLPVLRTRDVNDARSRDFLVLRRPQLIVSAFFNQRIGEALVRLAPLGAVNIHPSLLPAFKGVDPVFHARLHGSEEFGVTVHRVTPELDAGPVLAQAACSVPPGESVLATTARLYACGARLLGASLGAIECGAPGTPQSGEGRYDSWPSRAQVAALRRAGIRLARWEDLRLPAP
jgi:methionyl-tRNA formyltransferase